MGRLLVVRAPLPGLERGCAERKCLPSESVEWCELTSDGSQLVIRLRPAVVEVPAVVVSEVPAVVVPKAKSKARRKSRAKSKAKG